MSRIGQTAISIPAGVTVAVTPTQVAVKGPKGELMVAMKPGISVAVVEEQVVVKRANDELQTKALHGLVRSLINNQVQGVTHGFKKTLKLIGNGYRVASKGQGLSLSLGFSHPVEVKATPGVTFQIEGNDTILVTGIDKHLVGQVSANIRQLRPPEPYKGKGIRYENEIVLRKAGKTASK